MNRTGSPDPSTTGAASPSGAGIDPFPTSRRLRLRVGAVALVASASILGACGQDRSPLDPQPAAAAERPISLCRAVSHVPNAQYGPLVHRQEPGFTTPIDALRSRGVPMGGRTLPDCSGVAADTGQQNVAPNSGSGPAQHRADP
jgi:hypothetical protein